MTDAAAIVDAVADAVGLAEGEHGVRAVVDALARLEPVSIRRISRTVELPVPIVASVCGELRKRGVVAEERPARLTPTGRRLFGADRLALPRRATCPTCAGRTVAVPDELSRVRVDVARAARRAPPPDVELDQCHCTVETKLRRVLALQEAGALAGRRVLVLGDDDLTSLALASLVRRFGGRRTIANVTVVDVDDALVAFLRRELQRAPFPVACLKHDLREPLAPHLVGAFDTVVTDPPYTHAGAHLFLTRAAEALRGPGGAVFLSFGSKRPESAFVLQQEILQMGFSIRALVRDFNEYEGAGVLAGASHLYHLVATSRLAPGGAEAVAGPIYTRE